jgi:hypothetical protein
MDLGLGCKNIFLAAIATVTPISFVGYLHRMRRATPQASRKYDALSGSESQQLTIVSDCTISQLVNPARLTFAILPTEHLIRINDQNEIHHPPRRHGGALRECLTCRKKHPERKEQVLEEQERQTSSGSVSVNICFRRSRSFTDIFRRIGAKACKHGVDESGHCIRT